METKLQNRGEDKAVIDLQRGLRLRSTDQRFKIGNSDQGKLQSEGLIQELAESNRELNKVLHSLKDSELLFREFFESAPEAIVIMDLDTQKFVDFNSNTLKMFKYSAEQMLQSGPADISPKFQPDGRYSYNGAMEMIGLVMEGKKPVFEWMHMDSAGNQFLCEIRLTKLSVPGRNLFRGSMIDISEKKLAEQKLKESNQEINRILNSINDAFFSVDVTTYQYISVSPACEKIYGYPAEDFWANPMLWKEVIHPDDTHLANLHDERFYRNERVIVEYRIIHKDKSIRWVEAKVIPTLDKEGKLIRVDTVINDITERKKAEEKIKTSEQYNRALIENITDAIVLINENAETVFQSPSAERLSGFTLLDTKNKSVFEFIHPDDLPSCMKFFERVVANPGVPQHNQYRLLHKDGHYIWIEGTIINLLHNESVKAFIVNYRDITQRVEAEMQIEFESNNLDALINNTNDLMWSVDRDFNLITSNNAFDDMSKINFGRVVEKGTNVLSAAFTPEMMNHYKLQYERAFAGEAYSKTEHFTVPFEFWFEISYYPIRKGDEIIGTACYSRDITVAKKAEAEIAELNESLEKKVKERTVELEASNKELESFSYSVSHDLRAPLRIIDGYGKMLLKNNLDKFDAQGKDDLQAIMSNAIRMGNLIDDLLAFARLGSTPIAKKKVNMTEIVREVVEEIKGSTASAAEIHIQNFEDTNCDPALMKQVWTNLISNAVKYSGGKEAPLIEIGSTGLNGHQTYYIKDNGAGFDMQYADKLFAVFQRLHKVTEYEGTGVGLALAQRIITRHGGKIWADAKVNEGATFYFTLSN